MILPQMFDVIYNATKTRRKKTVCELYFSYQKKTCKPLALKSTVLCKSFRSSGFLLLYNKTYLTQN